MKTDEEGSASSLRSKAFLLFVMNMRPAEVARLLNMKKNTAYRYFQQWKKLPGDCFIKHKAVQKLWAKLSDKEIEMIADVLADELGTSRDAVLERMRKPWARKQMINGEWRNWDLPAQEKRQRSRLSSLTGRVLNRKSQEIEILIDLILHQKRHWYWDDDEEED